jgi:hypothetical protein
VDQYRFPADYSTTIGPLGLFWKPARQTAIISLDPERFLNRLAMGLVLVRPRMFTAAT